MPEDFYDVLGVSRDADEEEIQRAFREKAASYHPDVSDDPEAEEKFKKIKKAKEVLTDEEKRQMYDQVGHERFEQAEKMGGTEGGGAGAGGRAGGRAGGPFGGGAGAGGMGGFEDIFEQFFGGQTRRQSRGGSDLQTRIEVDLETAYHGAEHDITVTRPETCSECGGHGHPSEASARQCPECGGSGRTTRVQQALGGRIEQAVTCGRCEGTGEIYTESCRSCGGDGTVREETVITVSVPAGIQDGQTLRVDGEGAPGEPGTPDGDLLVEVTIADHPEFDRDGDDLHRRQPVSFPQVVFGDTVVVETLDGNVEMDVPAGTQSGETFRLRSKGMPRLRGSGHGDLYVEVRVVTPESLNDEQREALEAFAEAGGEDIDVDQGIFERLRNSF